MSTTRKKAYKACILPVAAELQIQKLLKSIATANGYKVFFVAEGAVAIQVRQLVSDHVESPFFGVLGEPHVNVLPTQSSSGWRGG
jgi:K+-transporting ATPase c subunit